jgi:hypothetical protein
MISVYGNILGIEIASAPIEKAILSGSLEVAAEPLQELDAAMSHPGVAIGWRSGENGYG